MIHSQNWCLIYVFDLVCSGKTNLKKTNTASACQCAWNLFIIPVTFIDQCFNNTRSRVSLSEHLGMSHLIFTAALWVRLGMQCSRIMWLNSLVLELVAFVQIPVLSLTSSVNPGQILTSPTFSFLICKMVIMLVLAS